MSNVAPFPLPAVSREPKRRTKRRILNASTLKALGPPPTGSVDHFDDLTPGLSLRVTSNDVRSWTVFFRDKNGRQKRLTLDRFPAVTLADARELAREAQRSVAKGGDPVAEKRAAREVLTFGALAERYIEDHAKPHKRSWAEDQRQLAATLLPKWKNRPAAEVTADDLPSVLNAKVKAGHQWPRIACAPSCPASTPSAPINGLCCPTSIPSSGSRSLRRRPPEIAC